jgi:hypothetical protein
VLRLRGGPRAAGGPTTVGAISYLVPLQVGLISSSAVAAVCRTKDVTITEAYVVPPQEPRQDERHRSLAVHGEF